METRYEVRLVVCKDCDTALDMTIGCENAQQLDKARRVIEERLLDYIAMFVMEQSLSGKAAHVTLPKPETSALPQKSEIEEREEPAMAKKTPERTGTRGLLKLRCKNCGDTFGTFLKESKTEHTCRCGNKIPLDWLGKFEYDCPECGRHIFGQTNIEGASLDHKCLCGAERTLDWNSKARAYTL